MYSAECPNGASFYNGQCYLYQSTPKTASAASGECSTLGGRLAHIPDVYTNVYTAGLLPEDGQAWFGLTAEQSKALARFDSGLFTEYKKKC